MNFQQVINAGVSTVLVLAMFLFALPIIAAAQAKIAFASDRAFNYDIYLMNADGSNQTRITTNALRETGDFGQLGAPAG